MTDLISRLEAAPTGSRELDAEIWEIIDNAAYIRCWWDARASTSRSWSDETKDEKCRAAVRRVSPAYTTSLDAALTLVPEGTEYQINNLYGVAQVELPLNSNSPILVRREDGNVVLALCIAAMKARQADG